MAFSFSKHSLKRLEGVHPKLVKLMEEAIKTSPHDFLISQGVRTDAEQYALYQQGRSKPGRIVTHVDGRRKRSAHQKKIDGYGYAIDFALVVDGVVDWVDIPKYKEIGEHIVALGRKRGIPVVWGGNWSRFKDYPHIELVRGD